MMIQIQEPNSPWEIVHMDWVTALPPDKDDTAMGTAITILNKVISIRENSQISEVTETQNSPQRSGKTSITFLEQSYHSPQPTTLTLMVWKKE
ncbi:hypothetical protein O181_070071 [Austropuccinia psidii MF-1]|uniref:Uncharacterized protein n=1 Tax=Austropuccinia psidii MF-1 TaxID=1389203 RepID=A0A9Q3EY06_9BASI|nr:hypothetical protein [Austropuccinia psidii MF-1]